ncbi:MAG: hypothetical protein ACPL1G_04050 [Thermodesulfovibrionales bacterium]
MKLKSREKILIFFALVALAIWSFDHFYYTPQKKKIKLLKEEIRNADIRLQESPFFAQSVKDIETEVASLDDKLNVIIDRTLKDKESRAFLKYLAKDSSRLQMKLISLDIQEEKLTSHAEEKSTSQSPYKKITTLVVLNTTYSALKTYLKDIEELPFLVTINHIRIEKNNDLPLPLKATMGLDILVKPDSGAGR